MQPMDTIGSVARTDRRNAVARTRPQTYDRVMSELDARRLSFGSAAAAYAAHRPDYPDAAIEWSLAPAPGHDVLDLGAGTGKLTASLAGRPGAHVVAVEPDPEMLAQLRHALPDVDARAGSAEEIPLPDASVDAVLIGQAWHWMDPERAL